MVFLVVTWHQKVFNGQVGSVDVALLRNENQIANHEVSIGPGLDIHLSLPKSHHLPIYYSWKIKLSK